MILELLTLDKTENISEEITELKNKVIELGLKLDKIIKVLEKKND